MYHYTIIQWLFFFYFYCFFGWVFESTFVSIKSRHFVNRGFMRGPFLPIYGSGAIMMLVVSMPFQDNIILTYLAGCVGATALELVTGMTMEALFKVRYWDYSNQKFNYKGHICLSSTIAWGFLTILMTEFVHPAVEKAVFAIPGAVISGLTAVLSVCIIVDFTLSFKAAMDLRNVLVGLEREIRKQEREEKTEELMDSLEEKFARIRERVARNPGEFMDDVKEEFLELRSKFLLEKEHRIQIGRIKDFYQRSIIKGNPGMRSARFGDALEELKKAVNERRNERKKD